MGKGMPMDCIIRFESARFGSIEVPEDSVLTFSDGLLGFAGARRFVVIPHGTGTPFAWLQSVDRPALAFLLLPGAAFPDYSRAVPSDVRGDSEVWVIVTVPGGKPQEMTANLLGPLVIDEKTRRGRQVILSDDRYSTRHRVFAATGTNRSGPQPLAAGAAGG